MNYPNKMKKENTYINHKNRGMSLEEDLNLTNQYYIDHNIALVYKKPTPITATKISYQNNHKTIKEGFFKTPSTTDYNGLYQGHYIDFEAKETKNKTSFPLANLKKHQLEHITQVLNHQGLAFLIIRFTTLNETYLLNGTDLINCPSTKSIPYSYIEEKGFIIKENYQPRLDYIKVVDYLIKEYEYEKN